MSSCLYQPAWPQCLPRYMLSRKQSYQVKIYFVYCTELSRELSFYVDEDVIEDLDYTEVDLVDDLSDTVRIEDKVLFTVSVQH